VLPRRWARTPTLADFEMFILCSLVAVHKLATAGRNRNRTRPRDARRCKFAPGVPKAQSGCIGAVEFNFTAKLKCRVPSRTKLRPHSRTQNIHAFHRGTRNSEKPRFPHAARTHRRARHHRRYEVRTNIGVLRRLSALLNWLQQVSPNIVCLQELKAADSGFPIGAVNDACCGASAASINAPFSRSSSTCRWPVNTPTVSRPCGRPEFRKLWGIRPTDWIGAVVPIFCASNRS